MTVHGSIEFVEHERPHRPSGWRPFVDDSRFDDRWWVPLMLHPEHLPLLSAFVGGAEVARIRLDRHARLDLHHGVPVPGRPPLEIDLIEVRMDLRRQRLGERVVVALAEYVAQWRLTARSTPQATRFWGEHLKWDRYEPAHNPAQGPLFMAPLRWP